MSRIENTTTKFINGGFILISVHISSWIMEFEGRGIGRSLTQLLKKKTKELCVLCPSLESDMILL